MRKPLKLSFGVAVFLSAPAFAAQQNSNDAAASGQALFFGRAACASCHEVNGRGGITGPDLSNAGRLTPAALRQKIVDPNNPLPPPPAAAGRAGGGAGGRGGPPPATIVVKMPDGRELRG